MENLGCWRFVNETDMLGVSKKSGIPKWMVYNLIMEDPIKMDDLGVPLFSETSIWLMVQKSGEKTS